MCIGIQNINVINARNSGIRPYASNLLPKGVFIASVTASLTSFDSLMRITASTARAIMSVLPR